MEMLYAMRTLQSEFPKRAEQFRQGSQVSGDVCIKCFAFKSRIHNMVSVLRRQVYSVAATADILRSMFVLYAEAYLSMEFYSPHSRFEGRPSWGNVSIFWAQRFERKCRTKIAAPQN